MSLKDGGPAFPAKSRWDAKGQSVDHLNGMSLRDYFAGQAVIGFVLAHCIAEGPAMTVEGIAEHAYALADAMIDEREMP